MLRLEAINQYYGGSHILRNVGFEAKPGEVTVILGRNGVGKTTLLKSLMGVVPVKTCSILLDGADITRDTPIRLFSKVVLPTPLRPRITVTSPGLASKPTLRKMCEPP